MKEESPLEIEMPKCSVHLFDNDLEYYISEYVFEHTNQYAKGHISDTTHGATMYNNSLQVGLRPSLLASGMACNCLSDIVTWDI